MITEHVILSSILPTPRKAWIHRATSGNAKDCLLFQDGELYTDRVKAPDILREAEGLLPPMTCVYLPNASAAGRHADYTCSEAFATFVSEEMPPWIERETGRFERLFLCGLSLSALQAVFTALRHPGVFADVLAQSPSAWWQEEWLAQSLPTLPATPSRFWLSVGTQELQTNVSHPPTPLVQITSQFDSVRRLSAAMTGVGHALRLNEYDGGHDPVCWGAELADALAWLLRC